MDKALLQQAIKKVHVLSQSTANDLTVEEAGVLQLFLNTHLSVKRTLSPEEEKLSGRIKNLLTVWQAKQAENPTASAANTGTQPFLQSVLKKFSTQDFADIVTAELEIAKASLQALSSRSNPDPKSQKIIALLKKGLQDYAQYQAQKDAAPDATSQRDAHEKPPAQELDSETLFTEKPRKKIRTLGGIDVNLTVSVYELEGDIELHGDVPDDTLLIIRNGGITVHGVVSGNIVASEDITVHGNVASSWVISSGGDIKTERALTNAHLIAQRGDVEAARTDYPACLFAWNKLHIHGDVSGGKLLGKEVNVEGDIVGAEVHSIGAIKADRVLPGPRGNTFICLRNHLSSEDYGTPLEKPERALYRNIGKHMYDAGVLSQFIRYAKKDNEDSRRTILYYLLGGLSNAHSVRTLRGLQCQVNYLEELMHIATLMKNMVFDLSQSRQVLSSRDIETTVRKCTDNLQVLEEDIETGASTFELAHKGVVVKACRELNAVSVNLRKATLPPDTMNQLVQRLEERHTQWSALITQLKDEIHANIGALSLKPEMVKTIEGAPEKLEPMLAHILAQLDKNPGSERYKRAKASVVRLMQTRINRNMESIRSWVKLLGKTQQEILVIRQTLGDKGIFLFPEKEQCASVFANHYDEGVTLIANPLPGEDPLSSAAQILPLSGGVHTPQGFRLDDNNIRKMR